MTVERDPLNVVRIFFIFVATTVWAASVGVSLFAHIPVDPWVHLICAAVVTALFGPSVWRRNGRSDG